ncbi:DegT/DnrJ/EryC1/StrS family aminotransferase [Bacillus cereus]|nr:DegT/DnrJ/EryC1/StrS aminotransferase family protein [Bacillus cereus]MDA2079890.1 DegT/DnrJ/EryC1/StrS aminotransferase family protein [Bacillus cereus]MDA2085480.1 DegT/DnrJ/EryC1/StrS aminotransferase family protein [Bacillus cereus]MDA2178582.1 DegT/DnrJ/EryC1/StrS aminotransferase family protein [Bacillus cereus]
MKDFIPFYLPDIGEEESKEVNSCLENGWLTTGMQTKKFENSFAEMLGENLEAIAVNSATAGLHLALEAIGIQPNDEVITTTYTFTATAEVIRYLGAHPIFIDIDSKTLMLDPNRIEEKITPRTKAIIPVHFAGASCDMDPILEIAHKYNLKVIEDAAHSLPTTYKGKLIGNLSSDATVFSFYATKPITTGEGGMIVTRNTELAKRCRIMRLHGINRDVLERYTSSQTNWYYEVVAPGYKYNLTDIQSSIGIAQLMKLKSFHRKRMDMAIIYNNALKDLPLILPEFKKNDDIHAWHLYVIRLHESLKITRNEFIEKMKERGIGCSVHFIPLHLQPYWRDQYNLREEDYPNANKAYKSVVSLPLYTKMSNSDQYKVINAIKEILVDIKETTYQ